MPEGVRLIWGTLVPAVVLAGAEAAIALASVPIYYNNAASIDVNKAQELQG